MKNNELTEVKAAMPSLEGLPQEVIEYVHGLVAEHAALKAFRPQPNGAEMMEALDAFFANEEYPEGAMSDAFEILCCKRVSTPATDAAIAEIKASGRIEGVIFTANRMLAAWEHGFINASEKEVSDITGAVLGMLEFLPKAEASELTREYADEVRARISANLRAVRKG